MLDEAHRQNPDLAAQGVTDQMLIVATYVLIGGIGLWCVGAAVLAFLVLRRMAWARIVLLVSAPSASVGRYDAERSPEVRRSPRGFSRPTPAADSAAREEERSRCLHVTLSSPVSPLSSRPPPSRSRASQRSQRRPQPTRCRTSGSTRSGPT